MITSTYKKIDVATAAFPVLLDITSATERYKLSGTLALSTNVEVNPTAGTPKQGTTILIDYDCEVSGAFTFKIFGLTLPATLMDKKLKVWCEYINSAWTVYVLPSLGDLHSLYAEMLDTGIVDNTTLAFNGATGGLKVKAAGISATEMGADSVGTGNIIAKNVTLTKIQDITRGSILVGGASDAPTLLDCKTSAQVLIGDGTDIKSVAVSGDLTATAGGVFSIAPNKILSALIKAGELVNAHINAAAGIVFTKMAALTASKIPVLNASGFIEASAVDATKLTYIDVTPGTRSVNKAIVVGASGKIDALDITALTLNGTAISATPAEINYLVGVSGAIQTQIDAGIAKVSSTILTGVTTTATAATLQSLYLGDTTGNAVTLVLPLANTVVVGTPVELMHCDATNAFTVAVQGADSLCDITDPYPGGADIGSQACGGARKGLKVICASSNTWQLVRLDP